VETGGVEINICPKGCSGHGLCKSDTTCQCDEGFSGVDCSSPIAHHGHFSAFLELEVANSLQPVVASARHVSTHKQDTQPVLPLTASLQPTGDGVQGIRVIPQGDDRSLCNNRGVFQNSKCFCDSGYTGETCTEELTCTNNCNSQGKCALGLCFCEPGYTGVDCAKSLPCLNSCSGNGVCYHGRCSCDAGYEGVDCADSAPRSELTGLTVTEVAILSGVTFVGGLFAGLAAKAHLEARKKARFNAMLQNEVNRPFMSSA